MFPTIFGTITFLQSPQVNTQRIPSKQCTKQFSRYHTTKYTRCLNRLFLHHSNPRLHAIICNHPPTGSQITLQTCEYHNTPRTTIEVCMQQSYSGIVDGIIGNDLVLTHEDDLVHHIFADTVDVLMTTFAA